MTRRLLAAILSAALLSACTSEPAESDYDIDPRLLDQVRGGEAPTAILSFEHDHDVRLAEAADKLDVDIQIFPELSLATVQNVRDVDLLIELLTQGGANRAEADEIFYRASSPAALDLIDQPEAVGMGEVGTGVTVAVLDTGIDYTHSDFGACAAPGTAGCRVVASIDTAPQDNQMDDAGRHGTNVSAIVARVAPGADLVAIDVFDGQIARASDVIAGLSWVVQKQSVHDIHVVNLSIGGSTAYTSTCDNTGLATAISGVVNAGIAVVSASGNDGFKNSMTSPGCVSDTIAVGAVYPAQRGAVAYEMCQDASPVADLTACFSNASPMLDILAPGVAIPGGGAVMTGTSQATPHVAAAAAILFGYDDELTPAEIKTALTTTGSSVTDPANNQSYPRLDIDGALSSVITAPTVPPTRTPSPTPEDPTTDPAQPQPSTNCAPTFAAPAMPATIPAEGTVFESTVDAQDGCTWSLASDADWMFPTSSTGTGSATVEWIVLQNLGDRRSSNFGLENDALTLTQDAGPGSPSHILIDGGMPVTESSTVTVDISFDSPFPAQSICVSTSTSCTDWKPFEAQVSVELPAVPGEHTVTVWVMEPTGSLQAVRLTDSIARR